MIANKAWDTLPQEFSHLPRHYFNTAYIGPIPQGARNQALLSIEAEMNPIHYQKPEWFNKSETVRELLAHLLGVPTQNVSHNTSIADLTSLIILGFPFERGDQVVTLNGDFPSNILPWMTHQKKLGFELQLWEEDIFSDLNLLEKNWNPKIKVVQISHVRFNTGKKFDLLSLGKFFKDKNVLFVVDGAQSFGSTFLSSEELALIDVFMAPTYKWLMGPYGHAFGYFSAKALTLLERATGYWLANKEASPENLLNYSVESKEGAYIFDRGQSANLIHLSLLEYSLQLLQTLGLKEIEEHNQKLTQDFISQLEDLPINLQTHRNQCASIVVFSPKPLSSQDLFEKLKEKGFELSLREGHLRASFHLFNTQE